MDERPGGAARRRCRAQEPLMLVVLVYSNSSSAPKRASSTVLRASSLSTSAIAAPTRPSRMRRPSRLFLRFFGARSCSEASRRLSAAVAQVLLDLLVAGHRLDRRPCRCRSRGRRRRAPLRRRREGCRAALRPRSGAARRGSRGRSSRGRRRGGVWSPCVLLMPSPRWISGVQLRITRERSVMRRQLRGRCRRGARRWCGS